MSTTITYQGVLCHEADFVRSLGSEPDVSSVVICVKARDLLKLTPNVHPDGFFPDGIENAPVRGAPAIDGKRILEPPLFNRGDLTIFESAPDGKAQQEPVVIKDLFVDSQPFEVLLFDERDDEDERVHRIRIQLVDIRKFWGRGFVSIDVNVLDRTGGAYLPMTLENGSAPFSVERWNEIIRRALPGRPRVRRINELVRDRDAVGGRFVGHAAKDALDQMMSDHKLSMSLDFDGSVAFWAPHEIDPDIDDPRTAFAAAMSEDKPENAHTYLPDQVVVIGGNTIVTVTMCGWEPVGRKRDGTIAPLEEALKDFELSLDDSRKIALMPIAETKRFLKAKGLSLTDGDLAEVRSFAWRWFRMPKASSDFGWMLPIVDRGDVDEDGNRLDPLIEARSFAEVTRDDEDVLGDSLGGNFSDLDRESTISPGGKGLLEPIGKQVSVEDPKGSHIEFQGARSFFPDFDPFLTRCAGVTADADTSPAEIPKAGEKVAPGSKGESAPPTDGVKGSIKVFVNLPRAPVSGATIDRTIGLVKFSRPVGWLEDPTMRTIDRAKLSEIDPGVVVTFGTELKSSGFLFPSSLDHRYVAPFDVKGGERIEHAKAADPKLFPLPIRSDELVLIVTSDGKSNLADLDTKAAELALRAMDDLLFIEAYRATFGRPVPIQNDGFIQSVHFRMSGHKTTVEIVAGSARGVSRRPGPIEKKIMPKLVAGRNILEAPLAPSGSPRTAGLGATSVRRVS